MKKTDSRDRFKKSAILFVIIGLFVGLFPGMLWAAGLIRDQINKLYHQASEMFEKANSLAETDPDKARDLYQKSVMRFERIVRDGNIHNGKLYYNIGNIYFKLKDMGRAILNYRRAQQYIPNDHNLQQNLDFARASRIDQIEEKQKTRILKTLFFWHYDLSTKARVFIFSGSFMLFWIFAAIRIFNRRPFTIWCILTAGLFSLLFAGSLFIEFRYLQKTRPGVIISSEVIARKGNSKTYEPSFKEPLHAGTEFTLIEKRGGWYYIELPDSRRCWVPAGDIELVR